MGIISIGHLKYRYPGMNKLALDDINVEIEQGEIIGVIGRSGSGKSTLAQALIGLVPNFYRGAYGGRVRVGEKVVGVRRCWNDLSKSIYTTIRSKG